MNVHLWGELGFYGPDRRGRFEVRIEEELPLREALRLIGVPEATSRSVLPVAVSSGSMSVPQRTALLSHK